MKAVSLEKEISSTSYPGRGIVLGRTPDENKAVIAYFIMGRSENSRNRVFVETEDGIETKAFDESKLEDPSLIIYHPVRTFAESTIVTNGDQTDTVVNLMACGKTFEQALSGREFEPDAPNYTPRISGIVDVRTDGDARGEKLSYKLSILKSANGNPRCCQRFTYDYAHPLQGEGHYIHTYMGDGNPLPSYEGEPTLVEIGNDDIDTFTQKVWNALDDDNKVSLFVRYIDIAKNNSETRIINKNK